MISKQWVQDHLDEAEAMLKVVESLTGPGTAHKAEVIADVLLHAARALLHGGPPATEAEIDARLTGIHERLAAHIEAGRAALDAKFDHEKGTP